MLAREIEDIRRVDGAILTDGGGGQRARGEPHKVHAIGRDLDVSELRKQRCRTRSLKERVFKDREIGPAEIADGIRKMQRQPARSATARQVAQRRDIEVIPGDRSEG